MHYVIGCGGVGSHLVPDLVRMVNPRDIALVDGDTLEEKNLDRQLFPQQFVGCNKAQALATIHDADNPSPAQQLKVVSDWFHAGLLRLDRKDWLFCCADNHACRRQVLEACDRYRCKAVLAANETTRFEAYYYDASFKDTPNDPRSFHPEILTDTTGDPLGPPGCVEAARQTPQLVLANAMAAQAALWLWLFWSRERKEFPEETKPDWPVQYKGNPMGLRTINLGQRLEVTCE